MPRHGDELWDGWAGILGSGGNNYSSLIVYFLAVHQPNDYEVH